MEIIGAEARDMKEAGKTTGGIGSTAETVVMKEVVIPTDINVGITNNCIAQILLI